MARSVRVCLRGQDQLLFRSSFHTAGLSLLASAHKSRYRDLLARGRFVFTHLCRQRLGQSQLPPRNHVYPHRIAQIRDLQFQFRIQLRHLRLPGLQIFQLKAQINALEVLKNVEEKKKPHHSAQPRGLKQILLFRRLHVPCQPRIIDPLHCAEFHHWCRFSLAHDFIPFPRTAVSHFATAGSPALLPRRASPRASSKLSARLAVPLPGTLLSRSGLHGSGTSKSSTALLNSLWRGPEKETARVPPSLDSPLSAAPETFLSRDAVSAFPIAFGTLPQPLPGAPYL